MSSEMPRADRTTTVEDGIAGVAPVAREGADTTAKGLAANQVSLLGAVTMGVGGTGPAYSLAASLAILVATVGVKAPAVMIVSFIPMLMVSSAFYSFARIDPDCGQAFSWTTRGMGPWMGWVLGFWGIAMIVVIGPNIANVVAVYGYLLFGLDGAANSVFWLTVGSVVLLALVTWLVATGIELSMRTQYVLMALQVGNLILFAAITIIRPLAVSTPGHVSLSVSMFLPTGMSWSTLASGMLLGVFFYNGWDVSVSVGEESKDSHRLPSLAAVFTPVILVALFVLCSAGALSYQGPEFVANNTADALSAVAANAFGAPWDKIVVLAVFTGTAAAALAMMVYLTRWTLSMASHGALGRVFGKVDAIRHIPIYGAIILGSVTIAVRIILAFLNENLVYDIVPSLALLSGISYAFTGFACAIYFRKWLLKSLRNFLMMGLFPVLGGAILMWVWVKTAITYWDPANSYSGGWLGVGATFWMGIGSTLLGFVLVLLAWRLKPDFFKRRPETWPGEGQPLPYQDETVV